MTMTAGQASQSNRTRMAFIGPVSAQVIVLNRKRKLAVNQSVATVIQAASGISGPGGFISAICNAENEKTAATIARATSHGQLASGWRRSELRRRLPTLVIFWMASPAPGQQARGHC